MTTNETVYAVLSGIKGNHQDIIRIYHKQEKATTYCKDWLDKNLGSSAKPGGPAQVRPRINRVIEVTWSPEDPNSLASGYSIVECQLHRYKPKPTCAVFLAGESNEELYVVYELGSHKILGVMDDIERASEKAKDSVSGLTMPVEYYH